MDCSEIGSLDYRNLCQTLSLNISGNKKSTLTSDPATDILILNELSDKELINICKVDKYINELCNNENFWMNKVLTKYKVLGSAQEIREKYITNGVKWKEYYLWLSGLLDGPIEIAKNIANNRDDLKILLNNQIYLPINTEGNLEYINDTLKGFLNEADFGPSDLSRPSLPLKEYMYVLKTGITNWNQILKLFKIYIRINKLKDGNNITVDELMKKWFRKYFESSLNINPDVDKLAYFHIIKLSRNMFVPEIQLTDTQKNNLKNSRIISRIQAENSLLLRILESV